MKRTLAPVLLICTLFLCIFCKTEKTSTNIVPVDHFDVDRPYNPWAFRSVLDKQPRILTLALHDKLWAAYSTENGALYKAWKGIVNFDGAVYTTLHGPQPTSLGNAWYINKHSQPWSVTANGNTITPTITYKGHKFVDGHVQLTSELTLPDGKTITVVEQPEYTDSEGTTGFERTFTTSNVPEGHQVAIQLNVSSVATQARVVTDGDFQIETSEDRAYNKLNGLDIDGKLMLKSNETTTFTTHFVKNPMIENSNKINAEDEEEEVPSGFRLIGKSDCKSCHNTFRKTIGPSYNEIAQRYRTTEDNANMLALKIKTGGTGVWGQQIMSAHPNDPIEDLRLMADYILSLDAEEEAKMGDVEETATAPADADYIEAVKDDGKTQYFPGVMVRVYVENKNIENTADVNFNRSPNYAGVMPILHAADTDMSGLESNFGIHVQGYLTVPKDGVYTMRLVSDDGSRLWVGDKEIINHDGPHGAEPMDGKVALRQGQHPFRIKFYQGRGGKYLSLRWKKPGAKNFEIVPETSLSHTVADRKGTKDKTLPMASRIRIPGDKYPLKEVHPSYDLSQARPNDFLPKVGGIDFLSDGRVVISTWDPAGSVYILDNTESGDPDKITVKTIAKGFAEPLGLRVVDDEIYVLQKQELTKLIDNNGDEIIDEYQTLSNKWRVSANFHEFCFGLAYKDGYFYAALATAINPGGASTQPQIPDRGKVVKISKEDGSTEFVAHGLRTPNGVGLGVDDEIFVSDNQGDWLPASKIVHVSKDAWFGSRSVDFEGTANLTEKKPVVWLPQDEIGNSPSTPLAINDGPYKGQMIHGEVTHGGIKRVFVEKVDGEYQGCLFRFIQGLEAGVNRLEWAPDGALYAGGIGSTGNWLQTGKLWYGLQRLKYNNKSTFEMLAIRAKSNGVEIELTEPLRPNEGWSVGNYEVRTWWYKPTKEYGGPKMDHRPLKVLSASVSEDRKKIFLELDGMKDNHIVYVRLKTPFVSDLGHQLWSPEAWYTMNRIPADRPGVRTTAPPAVANNSLSEEQKAAGWKSLFDGKTTEGWRNFKKETIGTSWVIDNGTIHLNAVQKDDGSWYAKDGGDIITKDEYENFELELQWKISDCGNSGIIYNVVESDEYDYVWQTGPEMQVLDNVCHPDTRFPTHRAGDLYDMIACKYETVKPAGEWNQVRLVSNNGKVEHWLNGHKLVEFEMHTDEWREMIANSKFKDMPGFGKARKGHISLQDHSDRVWYRNIRIRELSGEAQ